MKHAISSIEFILQTKGFRHGAGGHPMDPPYVDNDEYIQGFKDGQKARREYSEKLCTELGLSNPEIKAL